MPMLPASTPTERKGSKPPVFARVDDCIINTPELALPPRDRGIFVMLRRIEPEFRLATSLPISQLIWIQPANVGAFFLCRRIYWPADFWGISKEHRPARGSATFVGGRVLRGPRDSDSRGCWRLRVPGFFGRFTSPMGV